MLSQLRRNISDLSFTMTTRGSELIPTSYWQQAHTPPPSNSIRNNVRNARAFRTVGFSLGVSHVAVDKFGKLVEKGEPGREVISGDHPPPSSLLH